MDWIRKQTIWRLQGWWWKVAHPFKKSAPVTAEASAWTGPIIYWWERCQVCRRFRTGPYIYHEVYPEIGSGHGWWMECHDCHELRMSEPATPDSPSAADTVD